MTKPHQYRCETCTHFDCQYSSKPSRSRELAQGFFRKKGCASHSEFQRGCDKMLDRILKDLSGDNPDVTDCDTTDDWYGHGWDDCREHITKYIKDLRQESKPVSS